MKFLPELLELKDGTQVTNETWKERREEIVDRAFAAWQDCSVVLCPGRTL